MKEEYYERIAKSLESLVDIIKEKNNLDFSQSASHPCSSPSNPNFYCEKCNAEVTKGVKNFSEDNFSGKVYCMDCQKQAKKE